MLLKFPFWSFLSFFPFLFWLRKVLDFEFSFNINILSTSFTKISYKNT